VSVNLGSAPHSVGLESRPFEARRMSNGLDLRSHGQTAYPGNPQGAASDSLGALAITGIDEEI
jgi:hypothetical protein